MGEDVAGVASTPPAAEEAAKRRRTSGNESGDDVCSSSSSSDAGAHACPRTTTAMRVPFCMEALTAELADLRADPPHYVRGIGELVRPSAVCDGEGKLQSTADSDEEGPYDLEVLVCGQEGDDAYGRPWRVVLRFDVDLWPSKLALVRFQGVFHHALTDESNGMLTPFYRNLPKTDQGLCTVRLMLQAVHTFLVDPLKAWGIPEEKAPARLTNSLGVHRKMNRDRLATIDKYSTKVRHPVLFETPRRWRPEWLDPGFLKAVEENTPESWRSILTEHLEGEVFSFKLVTPAFCDMLVEEIFNFYESGLPARRPNSMNAYGIILNEIGLEPLIDELQRMLQPLGELLFWGPGSAWDGHHCFIVRYRAGEDLGLDMHTDDSDVTFNLCLGLDFTGAGLQFCGLMGAPNHRKHTMTYSHVKGSCVCHLGRKRHGADDIASGERLNLILWNHSSGYRQSDDYIKPAYHTEEGRPDAVCVSYTHDRDFGNFKPYPKGKEHFRGRGWCPRRDFEYKGFEPDGDEEPSGDEGCPC